MDIITRKQINILIQLAEVDKHFAKEEREMIFKIAKEKNFSDAEVKDLIRNPEPIDSLGALSLNQRFDYLVNAINLMLVDRKIFETELTFCRNIAIKLGFKKQVVEYLVEQLGKPHDLVVIKNEVFEQYF